MRSKNTMQRLDNFLSNLTARYQFAKTVALKINMGYNLSGINEVSTDPIASNDPTYNPQASATYWDCKYP